MKAIPIYEEKFISFEAFNYFSQFDKEHRYFLVIRENSENRILNEISRFKDKLDRGAISHLNFLLLKLFLRESSAFEVLLEAREIEKALPVMVRYVLLILMGNPDLCKIGQEKSKEFADFLVDIFKGNFFSLIFSLMFFSLMFFAFLRFLFIVA